jgi:hypothetical protein
MALLKPRVWVVRAIFLFLALAGALLGILADAGQQTKRSRAPKSADATSSDPEDARAASHAQIVRENNFGVALMNRQQFEQALGKFQRACILEPQSDIGCVNAGIALLNKPWTNRTLPSTILQRLPSWIRPMPTHNTLWAWSIRRHANMTRQWLHSSTP